jgi:hypothetical protein
VNRIAGQQQKTAEVSLPLAEGTCRNPLPLCRGECQVIEALEKIKTDQCIFKRH